MLISFLTSFVKIWVEFEEFSDHVDPENHRLIHQTYMKVLLISMYSLRLITLVYILVRLLLSVIFFVKMKNKVLNGKGESLSPLNYIILGSLITIIICRVSQYFVINIISMVTISN
jgi:hypothetical protein